MRSTLIITALLLATSVQADDKFPAQCPTGPYPFEPIQKHHSIDRLCGPDGDQNPSVEKQRGKALQNDAKNNLCATGSPETIEPQSLIDLQPKTKDVPTGQGKEPKNRSALVKLGEGKLVRMKAYLIEAHHADVKDGESVNCTKASEPFNDIHAAFGPTSDTEECKSVTGEISPHYRPASWNDIGLQQHNAAIAKKLKGVAFRITGQQFYDVTHTPGTCTKKVPPVRATSWEIHPITNIEVCTAGTNCDVAKDSDWVSFDKWWKTNKPKKSSHHG